MEDHGREVARRFVAHSASCSVTRGEACDCPVRFQEPDQPLTKATPAERNQRAKIRMDGRTIAHMLDLPAGVHVAHVYAEQDPYAIVVVVEGESLPPQPHDANLPTLGGTFATEQIWHHERTWMRWGWMR